MTISLSEIRELVRGLEARVADLESGGDPVPGFRSGGFVYFTASGSFVAADYPDLAAVRVRLVGGGGGGGGAAAASRSAGGGGGGGYAEKFIPVASLAASETVTIGAGGTVSAGDTDGGAGGTTSFGSHCSATGGTGGGMASDPHGGPPGVGTVGDLVSAGQGGMGAPGAIGGASGLGGGSLLGGGAESRKPAVSSDGAAGPGYGGGGSGAIRGGTAGSNAGGVGKPGIVIVELFY